jgi:hypothetical protein
MMEYWNNGILEYWRNGILECWKNGILECWNDGIMEWWNNGNLGNRTRNSKLKTQNSMCDLGLCNKGEAENRIE